MRNGNRPDSVLRLGSSGWFEGVERVPSPNFDLRPDPADISLLVIHNISLPPGQFGAGYIRQFFQNRLDPTGHPFFSGISELQVSAHLLIERDGSVVQFVSLNDRAWHAGVSQFCGRERCNDFSIGIELEGTDDQPYSDAQYAALTAATQLIRPRHPAITLDRIVGHSDIAPGRKTDPGPAFDWQRYRDTLE